jgi:hypothetical protein
LDKVSFGSEELIIARSFIFGWHDGEAPVDSFKSLNDITMRCMARGYAQRRLDAMLQCWSAAYRYDTDWPKAIDVAATCPFHFSHWSCTQKTEESARR